MVIVMKHLSLICCLSAGIDNIVFIQIYILQNIICVKYKFILIHGPAPLLFFFLRKAS